MSKKFSVMLLTVFFCAGVILGVPALVTQAQSSAPLDEARQRVQAAGSYTFESQMDQTMVPLASAEMIGQTSQDIEIRAEGQVVSPNNSYLQLSFPGSSDLPALGVLQNGAQAYVIYGDELRLVDNPIGMASPDGDVFVWLRAARNVTAIEPAETAAGTFNRYSFEIDGPTLARYLADQIERGMAADRPEDLEITPPKMYTKMTGSGELWIAADGLPVRQVLDLEFAEVNEQYGARLHIVTDFSDYGQVASYPSAQQDMNGLWRMRWLTVDPTAASETSSSSPSAEMSGLLAVSFSIAGLALLYRRQRRLVSASISILLILSFGLSPLMESFRYARLTEKLSSVEDPLKVMAEVFQTPLDNSNLPLVLNPAPLFEGQSPEQMQARLEKVTSQACGNGSTTTDTDGDTINDAAEYCLGTDPFRADSDGDLIPDNVEINGFEYNGKRWYSNPFKADTNGDGLMDVSELTPAYGGEAPSMDADNDGIPNLWDDDNDGDGVPDGVDLSPYSYSGYSDKFSLTIQNDYSGYLYIDVQVQPSNPNELRYHNSILNWPSDTEGQVQDRNNSNQDIRLLPFLDVYANQFPADDLLRNYGISIFRPEGKSSDSYHMYVPLLPVGDGTQNTAFYARVAYGSGVLNDIRWKDARVVWMVQMYNDYYQLDQLTPLQVYPGGNFRLTGMQVIKSGTVEASLYATPETPNDDRQLFNLIFGISATYMHNQFPNQLEIFNRFEGLNTEPQYKWGVTTDVALLRTSYAHTDATVSGLSGDINSFLSQNFSTVDTPSVVTALEYQSGVFSLDDLNTLQVSNKQTINLSTIREDTNRSLKLNLYAYRAGGWQQLTTEEVVTEITSRYEDLSTVLAELQVDYPDLTSDDLRAVLISFYLTWTIGSTSVVGLGGQAIAPAQRADQDVFVSFALEGINNLPAYLIEAAKLGQRDGGLRTGGSQLDAWEYQRQYDILADDVGVIGSFKQTVSGIKAFLQDKTNMFIIKTIKATVVAGLAIRTAFQAVSWASTVASGFSKMMSVSSRTLGVVGMVVATVIIWVTFALTTDFSNPIALTTAIIYAILSTALTVALFVISLNPIGAIIVAILMVIELICLLVSMGEFSLLDTIISAVTEFFYSGEYLTEYSDAKFQTFDTYLLSMDQGMTTGNVFRIESTFHGWLKAINGGSASDLYNSAITGTLQGVSGGQFWVNKSETTGHESVSGNRLFSNNLAAVEFTLPVPTINHVISLQSYIYVTTRMEECTFFFICWKSSDSFTYPNDIPDEEDRWEPMEMTLDILPNTLDGFLTWSALTQLDSDGDKLLNTQEGPTGLGTSSTNWDSDGDQLSDYFEYFYSQELGTDPLNADSDGDTLNDGFEFDHNLSINNSDTDGDGLVDNLEIFNQAADGNWYGGWDITLPGMSQTVHVFSDPLQADVDNDGLNDLAEMQNGTSPYAANLAPRLDLNAAPFATGSGGRSGVFVHPGDTVSLNLGVFSSGPRAVNTPLVLCLPDFATQITGGILIGSRTPTPGVPASCAQGFSWDFSGANTLQKWEEVQTTLTFTVDPDLAETSQGQIQLSLAYSSNDGQDQIITANIPVVIDLTAPRVFFSAPADGEIIGGGISEYVVGGSAFDDHSWVTQVDVDLPGTGLTTPEGISPWAVTWSLPADGIYTLSAQSTDYLGNVSDQASIQVMVDNTPPEVSTTLAEGAYVGGNILGESILLNLSGTAHDTTSGLLRVELSLDGRPWRAMWTDDGSAVHDINWSHTWEIPNTSSAQGYHTMLMRAYDYAGNLSLELERTIIVDVMPPTSDLTDQSLRTDPPWLPANLPVDLRGIANEGGNLPLPSRPVELVGELDALQDATIWLGMPSVTENDQGVQVAWLGDLNGDRLADLAVGLPAGNSGRGRLAIVYGKAGNWPLPPETTLLNQAETSFQGVDGAGLGQYFAPAGDVNGDGLADLLVGDPANNRVFIVFGRPASLGSDLLLDGPNSNVWSVLQAAPGESIGTWFAGVGDFNGDGLDDVLVGATGGEGHAYLLLGKSDGWEETVDLPAFAGAVFEYPQGAPLAGVGNLNGDFYSDLSITSGSTMYLFLGEAGFSRSGLREMPLSAAPASLTASVAAPAPLALGDVNGDTYQDFIFRNGNAPRLVFGAENNVFASRDLSGLQPLPNGLVAAPGDLNADGINDILVGNANHDAYLFLGTSELTPSSRLPEIAATFQAVGAAASTPYASAADLNSDGSSDLLLLPYQPAGLARLAFEPPDFIDPANLPVAGSVNSTFNFPWGEKGAGIQANTLTVDDDGCSGCYTTIQSAVDAATAGDTINIQPGVYGAFTVNGKNNLLLTGIYPDAVFVDAGGGQYAIRIIGAYGVELKNMTVRNARQAIALENAGQGGVGDDTRRIKLENILVYDYEENALLMSRTSTARVSTSTLSGDGGHIQVTGTIDPAYDPAWSDVTTPSVPTLNSGGDVFSLNDKLYMVRGGGSSMIDIYNKTSNSWSSLVASGTFGTNSTTAIGPDGKIWAYQVNGYGNYKLYMYNGSAWDERANLITYGTEHAGPGAAIVTSSSGQPYMMQGNNSAYFYIYWGPNVGFPDGYWNYHNSLPGAVGAGGSIVDVSTSSGEYFYALRGGGTTDFYRFDFSTGTWSAMSAVRDPLTSTAYPVDGGANLAWDGKDFIYASTGGNGRAFLRYSIPGNRWELLGDGLLATPNDEDIPLPMAAGAGMTYFNNYIYLTPGGGINRALYRYGPFSAQPPAKLYLDHVAFITPENLVDIHWMNLDPKNWLVDFRVDGLENSWVGGPATQWSPYPYDMPLLCQNYPGTGLPLHYEGFYSLTHSINVPDNYFIADLNIQDFGFYGTPSYRQVILTAPWGQSIELASSMCGNFPNTIQIDLDDESPRGLYDNCDPVASQPYPIGASYRPYTPLANFDGHLSAGTWTLTINNNGGASWNYVTLNSWGVEVCHGAAILTHEEAKLLDPARDVYRVGEGSRLVSGYHTYRSDAVVAPSGTEFSDIQGAILSGANRVLLRPGSYDQRFYLVSGVEVIGSGAESTIITPPPGSYDSLVTAEGVVGAALTRVTLVANSSLNAFHAEGGARNSSFSRNIVRGALRGLLVNGAKTHIEVFNNTLYANVTGLQATGCADLDVRNTIFANSSLVGLQFTDCSPVQLHTYNDFWDNTQDIDPLEPGPGEIFVDPQFLGPMANNFRTRDHSPVADAGNPSDPVPPGTGERADIGYLEQGRASFYVDDDYCADCINDNLTWGVDAFNTIQDGLNAASTYIQAIGVVPETPVVVGVGAGEYIEPAEMPSYVHLAGSGADQTTLTNEWQDLVSFDNVINARVSGFTLRDAGRAELWPRANVGSVGLNTHIAMVLDNQDRPHYCHVYGGSLYYTTWNGSAWVTETLTPGGGPNGCEITLDASGYPHISYILAYESAPFVEQMALHYTYKDGTGWHDQSLYTAGAGFIPSNYSTAIYLNGSGYPVIFYTRSDFSLYYQTWNGSSWSDQPVGGENGYSLSLAVDSTGNPHLAYNNNARSAIRYAHWTGSAWQVESIASGFLCFTGLALDSSDLPHITFVRWEGARELDYATYNGATWTVQTLPGSTGAFSDNDIDIDSQDRPHIVYNLESSGDLRYTYWDGSAWVNLDIYPSNVYIGYYNAMHLDSHDLPVIGAFSWSEEAIYAIRYLGDPGSRAAVRVRNSSGITIDHNRILNNRVGIFVSDLGSARAEFNTLVGHSFDAVRAVGQGSWVDFENNIVFNFGNGLRTVDSGVILNNYNLVQNLLNAYVDDGDTGIAQSEHDILAASAGFQDAAGDNYHLQQTSAAVDSADPLMTVPAGGGQSADMGYSELLGAPALIFLGKENVSTTTGYSTVQTVEFGISVVSDPTLPEQDTLPATWTSLTLNPLQRAIGFWNTSFTPGIDGLYRIYSRATDQVGNQEEAPAYYEGAFIADSTAPEVAWVTSSGSLHAPFELRATASDYDAIGQFSIAHAWFVIQDVGSFASTWAAEPWNPEAKEARPFWIFVDLPDGTYTVFAEVEDQAGNRATSAPLTITVNGQDAADTIAPTLTISQPSETTTYITSVTFSGQASDSGSGIAAVEISLDGGYTWLPAAVQSSGTWSLDWDAPSGLDYVTFPVRIRASDRAGNQTELPRRLTVDNQSPRDYGPVTFSSPEGYHFDAPTSLTVTWRQPRDGSGQAETIVIADQNPNTEPELRTKSQSQTVEFDRPGVWYVHLGVVDPSGSKLYQHYGPWYVGDMLTNCADRQQSIQVDGHLETGLNEWLAGERLDTDERPAARYGLDSLDFTQSHELYLAWDSDQLFLGFRGAWWRADGTLWAFLDTAPGGSSTSPLAGLDLPFQADLAVQVDDESSAWLYTWNGAAWEQSPLTFAQSSEGDTEAALPFHLPADNLKLMAVAVNDQGGLSSAFPTTNGLEGLPSGYYEWNDLCTISDPADDQPGLDTVSLALTSPQAPDMQWGPGQTLDYTLTLNSFEKYPLSDLLLTLNASDGLGITAVTGATCLDCPAGGSQWQVSIPALASLSSLSLDVQAEIQSGLGEIRQVTLNATMLTSNLPSSTRSHRTDGIPPEVWADSLPGNAIRPGVQIFSGTASDGDGSGVIRVDVQFPGSSIWLPAYGANTWNIENTVPGDQATYTLRLRALDAAGNLSAESQVDFYLDIIPPTATMNLPALVGGRTVIEIQGTALDPYPSGAQVHEVQVQVDSESAPWRSGLVYAPTAKGEQTWQFTWGLPLEDNLPHQLRARAIDAAGNIGEPTAWQSTLVDTIAPQVNVTQEHTAIIVTDYLAGSSGGPVLSGSISDNGGVASLGIWLYDPFGLVHFTELTISSGAWNYTPVLDSLDTGIFSMWLETTDVAGNRRLLGPYPLTVVDQNVGGLVVYSNPNPAPAFSGVDFFAGVTNGTNVMYLWDFGDGSAGQGSSPHHTYTAPGTYTVEVLAFNMLSAQRTTLEQVITPGEVRIFLPLISH
jgi:hypothetical protein